MGINVLIMLHAKAKIRSDVSLAKKNDVSCLGIVSAAICEPKNERQYPPVLCTAPIKVGMQPVQFNLTFLKAHSIKIT